MSRQPPSTEPDRGGRISAQNAQPEGVALLCAALAAASFASMDSVIKLMSVRYDPIQLGFLRFAGGSVFAVALWVWRRSPLPARNAWPLHLLRSVFLLF